MNRKKNSWKNGPGKLGIMIPLLGSREADSDSTVGKLNIHSVSNKFSVDDILAGQ